MDAHLPSEDSARSAPSGSCSTSSSLSCASPSSILPYTEIDSLIPGQVNIAGVTTRAIYHPIALREAIYSHTDGLFMPCVNLAFATIFVGIIDFGVPYVGFWLVRTMFVVWFVYLFASFALGMFMVSTLYVPLPLLFPLSPFTDPLPAAVASAPSGPSPPPTRSPSSPP